jgi:hypothetical protein
MKKRRKFEILSFNEPSTAEGIEAMRNYIIIN